MWKTNRLLFRQLYLPKPSKRSSTRSSIDTMSGHVEQILIKSPKRMNPPCPVQDRCGGCALMTCTLPYQAEIKEELLKEALTKYAGKIDFRLIKPIVVNPVPYSYRNQCKLPVRMSRGQLISGMYQPSSNHFVAVDRCLVHEEELDIKRTQILAVLQKHGWDEFNPRPIKDCAILFCAVLTVSIKLRW